MRGLARVGAVVLGVSMATATQAVHHDADRVDTTLGIPGRTNANVSIAAHGDVVAVVWGAATADGATDIEAAVSQDGGRSFNAPVRVSPVTGGVRVSGEQPPHVALAGRPGGGLAVVVVWTARAAEGARLLTARSEDGGRSFGPPSVVPGSDAGGNRGWEAIATGPDGRVAAIWLDHRELARASSAGTPMHHDGEGHAGQMARPDGAIAAQSSKLYFGRVDGLDPPVVVTGGVCYCCKTALGVGGAGQVYAAWRHVYPGNLRDIAFAASVDGGRTFAAPVRVSEDHWAVDGCPENGPAIAVAPTGRVHAAWPTMAGGAAADESIPALFYAWSDDGQRFTPRQRLPTEGTPGHVQAAIDAAGGLMVVWDELVAGRRRVVLATRHQGDGRAGGFNRAVISGNAGAAYPVVALGADGAVVAWTDGGPDRSAIRVARLARDAGRD
ncbi:MAG: sialidase family protein [Acidobacteriota bacterium]